MINDYETPHFSWLVVLELKSPKLHQHWMSPMIQNSTSN
jgi:hypothetical protein